MFRMFESAQSSNFIVVDKSTDKYLTQINEEELSLFIRLLRDLNHPNLDYSKEVYGVIEIDDKTDQIICDKNKLTEYKYGILTNRMENQGYTFFKLYKHEKLIGLASGNINEKSELELQNFVIHPDHRKQGYGEKLLREISQHIHQNNEKAIITIPLSVNAQNLSMPFYEKIIPKIDPQYQKKDAVEGKIELVFSPCDVRPTLKL